MNFSLDLYNTNNNSSNNNKINTSNPLCLSKRIYHINSPCPLAQCQDITVTLLKKEEKLKLSKGCRIKVRLKVEVGLGVVRRLQGEPVKVICYNWKVSFF